VPETLKRLIDIINFLPGIGEKTAAKLAFFLLKANPAYVKNFSKILAELHENVMECTTCHGMTDKDHPVCKICSDPHRSSENICIVEDYLDMIAIERT
jgi:recombination protein RecR